MTAPRITLTLRPADDLMNRRGAETVRAALTTAHQRTAYRVVAGDAVTGRMIGADETHVAFETPNGSVLTDRGDSVELNISPARRRRWSARSTENLLPRRL